MSSSGPASTQEQEVVLAERRGQVLLLTLNRPARLNAWTDAMEDRYFELLDEAEADPDVRAVVVTGAERGFCAGADMANLQATGDGRTPTGQRPRPRSFPLTLRLPLIAAINGAAVGLGLVEALYCDVRFATPTAKLSTMFAQRGLIAEYGISWLLPRIVGMGHALDLLLSGRVIDGAEAHMMGMVNRVVEPTALVDEAVAYAHALCTRSSPASMAAIKRQVYSHAETSFEQASAESDTLMAASFTWPDFREGVASYVEKREPSFQPLGPASA